MIVWICLATCICCAMTLVAVVSILLLNNANNHIETLQRDKIFYEQFFIENYVGDNAIIQDLEIKNDGT